MKTVNIRKCMEILRCV